jgi:NAD(P)-dependent dehydrogenase (short-subunit alcohol dehydrogenase family)
MDTAADADRPVSLVTGAGSGIGRAVATRLAGLGHRLVLVGRTGRKLEETAQPLAAAGHRDLELLEADVSDPAQAHACVDRAIERFGRLDAIVNAAGIAPRAPIERTDEELLDECFRVNAFGPAFLMIRAFPHMKARKSGCVVNVSTLGTTDPFPGFFAYAASKAALDSFTRSLAREGKAAGIRAYVVNPGAVETPLLRSNFPAHVLPPAKALPPEAIAEVIVDCIEGRRPERLGECVALPSP